MIECSRDSFQWQNEKLLQSNDPTWLANTICQTNFPQLTTYILCPHPVQPFASISCNFLSSVNIRFTPFFYRISSFHGWPGFPTHQLRGWTHGQNKRTLCGLINHQSGLVTSLRTSLKFPKCSPFKSNPSLLVKWGNDHSWLQAAYGNVWFGRGPGTIEAVDCILRAEAFQEEHGVHQKQK